MRAMSALIAATLLAGCANQEGVFGDAPHPLDGSADGQAQWPDATPLPDGVAPYAGDPVIFAHSAAALYEVNPTTFKVTLVGNFKWPGGSDEMTDIAVDRKGKMTGISYDSVYSVDPKTAACTYLAALDTSGSGTFNGLSYIAVQAVDVKEVLMASAGDGSLYEVDPATGTSKKVGAFGGGLGSSGDLVSVKGLGTLATVKKGFGLTDWLARVDPLTGAAQIIGDVGFADVWGLGFWKDKVYGFTEAAEFLLIDPKTGKGTLQSAGGAPWWGAGVTTSAPVIE